MKQSVTKAIFPVAGLGTRFLPATKSIPKEIMTLVDRPLIQYAIDEARSAGISDFIFVTSRGKGALEDYFDSAPHLENALRDKGKEDLLRIVRETTMHSGQIVYVRQREQLGLGHAVGCVRQLISDEPFAVILPDDVITGSDMPCMGQMVEAYAETGGSLVAAMDVTPGEASSYGLLDPGKRDGRLVEARGLVEKPPADSIPSTLAVIGRYILTPSIFSQIDALDRGSGGEIQLTDALSQEAASGSPVHGFLFEGRRFDCGSKAGFIKATVALGLERSDLADDFRDFLSGIDLSGGPG